MRKLILAVTLGCLIALALLLTSCSDKGKSNTNPYPYSKYDSNRSYCDQVTFSYCYFSYYTSRWSCNN